MSKGKQQEKQQQNPTIPPKSNLVCCLLIGVWVRDSYRKYGQLIRGKPNLDDCLLRGIPKALCHLAGSCLESLFLCVIRTAYRALGEEGLVNVVHFRDFLKVLSYLLPV